MSRTLEVYLEHYSGPVGQLRDLGPSPEEIEFTYQPEYLSSSNATPLSLRLPVRNDPFGDRDARPFFENLLPEGRHRDEAAALANTTANDVIGILSKIGRDCAGSVSVTMPGTPPAKRPGVLPDDYPQILEKDLVDSLKNLEEGRPAEPGTEASVAGVQAKRAIARGVDGKFRSMRKGAPSNYLLKVADRNFPGGVVNEFFCLSLAQRVGLPTATVNLQTFKSGNQAVDALVVERYDRRMTQRASDGAWEIHRLHQEDFAQACGYTSFQKYEHRGGPGIAQLKSVIMKTAVPARNIDIFARVILFNLLIGNSDAHAKNFALLWSNGPRPELAPLYDLVCIRLYPRYRQEMAQRIGGSDDPEAIGQKELKNFAEELGVGPKFLLSRFRSLLIQIIPAAQGLLQQGNASRAGYQRRILSAIAERVRLYSSRLNLHVDIPDGIDTFVARSPAWNSLS